MRLILHHYMVLRDKVIDVIACRFEHDKQVRIWLYIIIFVRWGMGFWSGEGNDPRIFCGGTRALQSNRDYPSFFLSWHAPHAPTRARPIHLACTDADASTDPLTNPGTSPFRESNRLFSIIARICCYIGLI